MRRFALAATTTIVFWFLAGCSTPAAQVQPDPAATEAPDEPEFATEAQLADVLGRFEALSRRMCACNDGACVKRQMAAMEAFMRDTQQIPRPQPDTAATTKFMARMTTASNAMKLCMDNRGSVEPEEAPQTAPGTASRTPTAQDLATALTEFEAITDGICRCTDDACRESLHAKVTEYTAKIRSWAPPDMNEATTKSFMAKMQMIRKRFADCMSKVP